jgi:LacI family transcriptional regulator
LARRPTISDVAARAGVHPGTASRALNPALPGRVTETTARKVREAARELGYLPDPTARSLRTRRSGVVGVVVPDLTNPVLPPIVRGIEETLWDAGLACLLADTDNDVDREAAVVAEFQARRCEGLIVATATRTSATVSGLDGGDLPTVLVTRDIDGSSLPFVAADDASGVRALVQHLVDLGHVRIAYLTGPASLSTTLTRETAFRNAIADLLGPDDQAVVRHGASFTIDAGRRLTQQFRGERRATTAIVAGNDMMAIGCLEALTAAGLRCPQDVSVAGHNDMPLVGKLQPPLTTVAFAQQSLGVRAAQVLLGRLADNGHPAERELVPTELVVRGSTGPPPTPRPVTAATRPA